MLRETNPSTSPAHLPPVCGVCQGASYLLNVHAGLELPVRICIFGLRRRAVRVVFILNLLTNPGETVWSLGEKGGGGEHMVLIAFVVPGKANLEVN